MRHCFLGRWTCPLVSENLCLCLCLSLFIHIYINVFIHFHPILITHNMREGIFLLIACKYCLNASHQCVTYWTLTEPSIKRCTCVNKRKGVEDIGISPWPGDVVEFSADAYAQRKQVDVKQLYNQVQQTYWVSSRREFELQLLLESVGDRMHGPSVTPGWSVQPECERSAATVRGTWGQYVTVCLQLTSHT